jgi:ribosome biogenesis GTPase
MHAPTTFQDDDKQYAHMLLQVVSTGTKYVRVNIHPQLPPQLQPPLGDNPNSSNTTSSSSSQPNGSSSGSSQGTPLLTPPKPQLLCTVRALLKKMQQTVLVGDRVTVTSVDWVTGRGTVQDVAPRSSELTDPAVANVDHVVLVFGLKEPPVGGVGFGGACGL